MSTPTNPLDPHELIGYRHLAGRSEARQDFDRICARTQQTLRILDFDGAFWAVGRREFVESVQALLARNYGSTVTLLVHSPAHLLHRCGRLVSLAQRHPLRLRLRQIAPAARTFTRGAVVADEIVCIRRPSFASSRCFVDFDETAVMQAVALLDALESDAQDLRSAGAS